VSVPCPICFRSVNRSAPYAGDVTEERAWFGRRVVAFLIDWFASILVAVFAFPQFPYSSNGSMAATLGVFFFEVCILTWLTGASFGQRIVGLRVVSINEGRLPLWRVLIRTTLICLVIPAVVYDDDGRGVHDRIANTRVLRVR